jgi:cytochrome c6
MQKLSNEFKNCLIAGIVIVCVYGASLHTTGSSANAAAPGADGGKIFATNCASCHSGGGNIVDPKKPLKGAPQLANKELLKSLLMKPVGTMPSFPQIAQNDADLTALFTYCKSLK